MLEIGFVIIYLGLACQILGLFSFFLFYFKKPASPSKPLPGVSIIKPCYNTKDGEEENFDSFFNQEYEGELELIFVVSDQNDPAIPLINRFIQKYPSADAKLIVSETRKAYWRKIDAYYDAYKVAKHDYLIISDSDTFVGPEYVSQMVASLDEKDISFVTVPQYDTGANNIPTAIKVLGNNCDVAVYVMLMNLFIRKKKIAFGHSICFKKSTFENFEKEAWYRLQNYFGDDLILPSLFIEHGKKVVYRNIYCPVRFANKSFSQVLDQQCRFAVCQRIALGPLVYIPGLILSPIFTSFILFLWTGFQFKILKLFLIAWATRVLISFAFEGLMLKSVSSTLKYFWTIPLWDLLKSYFVLQSFKATPMYYHGKKYKIASDARVIEIQ